MPAPPARPAAPRGLYLVTRETPDTERLVATVHAALDGGAVRVQYRDKSTDRASRFAQALALKNLCAQYDVDFVINDDVELALSLEAGVHVGREDSAVEAARLALGSLATVGASCYDSIERAAAAANAGASYLAFGSFFTSPTKPNAPRATLDVLRAAAKLALPRVAIGGITLDNARPLVEAGVDQLAVITAVFDAPDPRAAARAFTNLFEESK
jgi:thiamine-phosphate pyrophosphorylase